MDEITKALQELWARIKLPIGALTNEAKYMPFKAALGDATGAGFSTELTLVQTNWEGQVNDTVSIRGLALGVIHDTLKNANNAADAYEFLTKVNVKIKLPGGRAIDLGRAYNWPQVHGPAVGYVPGASSALVDHTIAGNGVGLPTKMLAEPVLLKKGQSFHIEFEYDPNDVPTFSAQQFVDVRVICDGREPVV